MIQSTMITNKRGMEDKEYKLKLRDFFAGMRLLKRNELINNALRQRTRYITVVLENIYQSHNASAVLRSCDCFGIQDVHIIENSFQYEINPHVVMGATQWLTMNKYNQTDNNTALCITQLKEKGYQIVSTTPKADAISIHDFDVSAGKFALLFGTEKFGLTDEALALSDELVRIPMYGFTESFNISVSAALCLFHFTDRIRKENVNWQLSEDDQLDLHLQWFRNTITGSEILERSFKAIYEKNIL